MKPALIALALALPTCPQGSTPRLAIETFTTNGWTVTALCDEDGCRGTARGDTRLTIVCVKPP